MTNEQPTGGLSPQAREALKRMEADENSFWEDKYEKNSKWEKKHYQKKNSKPHHTKDVNRHADADYVAEDGDPFDEDPHY